MAAAPRTRKVSRKPTIKTTTEGRITAHSSAQANRRDGAYAAAADCRATFGSLPTRLAATEDGASLITRAGDRRHQAPSNLVLAGRALRVPYRGPCWGREPSEISGQQRTTTPQVNPPVRWQCDRSDLAYNDEVSPSCRATFAACQRGSGHRGRALPYGQGRTDSGTVYGVGLTGRATSMPFTAVPIGTQRSTTDNTQRPRPALFPVLAGDESVRSGFASRWLVRLASALPCPAGRSVPGRRGPERRRRPRPDGTAPSVRAGSVAHRDHRGTSGSPTVTNGQEEPQVGEPPGQAARKTLTGRSDCGPEGRGFESPRSPHRLPAGQAPNLPG